MTGDKLIEKQTENVLNVKLIKDIVCDTNKHHLFGYNEIKTKLTQILGEPKTEEEIKFIQGKTRKIWYKMPKFRINKRKHEDLHKTNCHYCGKKRMKRKE